MRYYSNVAALATITTVGGISTGATEVALSTTTGFPAQYPFTLRLDPDTSNEELITVTGPKSGSPGTLLITRASDGTTAKSHAQGAPVVHGVSARDFQEPQDHIANVTVAGVHGLPESAWEPEFTVYKGTDQGYTSDTTLNDDTVLKFTALPNTKYRIQLYAYCSGTGGNIKLAWKTPSGSTALRAVLGPAANSTNRDDTNVRVGAHGLTTEVAYGLNSDTLLVCIQETFVLTMGSTGGDVVLQHAQGTSSAAQTVMRGQSFMIVKQLING
jgi:hypothetical protein